MTPVTDIWLEHKTRLRSYIAKRVRKPEAVDDILQEVFVKAYVALHTVESPGSFPAWLYRITANTITDYYRAQKHWDELSDELASPEAERDYVAELASCVQPLIAELPETYRDALMMSDIEGIPQKDVAERLGISLSGAKSRVQRGREKLRQRLLDCCDIETSRGRIVGYEPRDKSRSNRCG
ncbi:MAG: RNA polymerase sigma factor SigZ [Gammaproteobacteria bacterium]